MHSTTALAPAAVDHPAAYDHECGTRRALVCFQRQVEAQCDVVAPRPCSVYVASDSGAVSRLFDSDELEADPVRAPPEPESPMQHAHRNPT